MKKYLSIGEVAKLKGFSVKSLRYYGELGILIPAYVNPETGYRYYTTEQMVILDLISVCLDFDIPLKNFNSYITEDGLLSMGKILEDGRKIAEEKIAKLNITLGKLESITKHIEETQTIKKNKGEYKRDFEKRYLYTREWRGELQDLHAFIESVTKIYIECESRGIRWRYNQGIIWLYENEEVKVKTFVEVIDLSIENREILELPDGEYNCEVFSNDEINELESKYIEGKSYPNGTIIIVKEMFDSNFEYQPTPVEVQFFDPR